MTKQPVIIVDILNDVIDRVNAMRVTPVKFMYGPWREIEANLVEIAGAYELLGGNTTGAYPLIAVIQDFPENREGLGGYYADVTLPFVIIATLTDNTYKAPQRYSHTFKPVLYPIYSQFMDALARESRIIGNDPGMFQHTKYDRLYYGKETLGTAVSDYVDAIELNNLKLTVAQSC